jgi:hypothetical protein
MRYIIRGIAVILFVAAIAAWLKTLFPNLSIGYWPLWKDESVRNKIGIAVVMPLYEIFYLWHFYLLSVTTYGIIFYKLRLVERKLITAPLIGALLASSIYLLYQLTYYFNMARTYAIINKNEDRSMFSWISYPKDMELLFIYAFAGLLGGWFYYKLSVKKPSKLKLNTIT